jgi:MSHA biogenesis protein MshJ
MSALSAQWQSLKAKFEALNRREKLIVAFLGALGPAYLGFSFGVEPMLLKAQAAAKTTDQAKQEVQTLQAQLTVLTGNASDPDKPNRLRLEQLTAQLGQVSGRLARFEAGMVPPQRMQDFLQGLLSKNRNLELVGLVTLPVSVVGAKADKSAEKKLEASPAVTPVGEPVAPAQGIYQHGLELKVAGSYNDILNYLAEIERLPQHVMWNTVSLTVDKYPRSIITIRVFTLSLDPNWMVVS